MKTKPYSENSLTVYNDADKDIVYLKPNKETTIELVHDRINKIVEYNVVGDIKFKKRKVK